MKTGTEHTTQPIPSLLRPSERPLKRPLPTTSPTIPGITPATRKALSVEATPANTHLYRHPAEGIPGNDATAEGGREPTRILLTVQEAAKLLGIGRTLMYSLVMSGEVESVPIGRLRRVPAESVTEYVARLRASHNKSAVA